MQYEWTVDINVTCNDKGLQTPSTPQRDLNVKNKLDVSGSRPGFTFSLFSLASLSCISNLSFKIRYVSGKFLWRMRGAAMKTLSRLLLVLIIPIRAKAPEGSDTSIQLSYLETGKKTRWLWCKNLKNEALRIVTAAKEEFRWLSRRFGPKRRPEHGE